MTSQYQLEDAGGGKSLISGGESHTQTHRYTTPDGKVKPRSEVRAPAADGRVSHDESLEREHSQVY